jgi:hypothetical protein
MLTLYTLLIHISRQHTASSVSSRWTTIVHHHLGTLRRANHVYTGIPGPSSTSIVFPSIFWQFLSFCLYPAISQSSCFYPIHTIFQVGENRLGAVLSLVVKTVFTMTSSVSISVDNTAVHAISIFPCGSCLVECLLKTAPVEAGS